MLLGDVVVVVDVGEVGLVGDATGCDDGCEEGAAGEDSVAFGLAEWLIVDFRK